MMESFSFEHQIMAEFQVFPTLTSRAENVYNNVEKRKSTFDSPVYKVTELGEDIECLLRYQFFCLLK